MQYWSVLSWKRDTWSWVFWAFVYSQKTRHFRREVQNYPEVGSSYCLTCKFTSGEHFCRVLAYKSFGSQSGVNALWLKDAFPEDCVWVQPSLWITSWSYSKLNLVWKPLQQCSFVQCSAIHVVKGELRKRAGTNLFSLATSDRTRGNGMKQSQGSCINVAVIANKCSAMTCQIPVEVAGLYP